MKKSIFFTLNLITVFSIYSFAQGRSATSCGSGCYTVVAKARNDQACGGNMDLTYTITNNSNQTLDIKMYVEKRTGEWKDLGLIEGVNSGQVLKDAFWSCDLSGRNILFYRITDSGDRFPTQTEINNDMRSGYR
jgi:hypothetical protein